MNKFIDDETNGNLSWAIFLFSFALLLENDDIKGT